MRDNLDTDSEPTAEHFGGSVYNRAAIDRAEALLGPGGAIGPAECALALERVFGGRNAAADAVVTWLRELAEGKPSAHAPGRSVRGSERLRAIELLGRFSGAEAAQECLKPTSMVGIEVTQDSMRFAYQQFLTRNPRPVVGVIPAETPSAERLGGGGES
jgi:hypothetical protein